RLLQLWDEATGMHSTVPRGLANQTVSVDFSGLPLNEAVRRIFEKIPLDYVFIAARGIIVTGSSQSPATPALPAVSGAPPVHAAAPGVIKLLPAEKPDQTPFVEPEPLPPIPTPFGPVPNYGQNTVIQLPPVGGPPSPPAAPAPPAASEAAPVYEGAPGVIKPLPAEK